MHPPRPSRAGAARGAAVALAVGLVVAVTSACTSAPPAPDAAASATAGPTTDQPSSSATPDPSSPAATGAPAEGSSTGGADPAGKLASEILPSQPPAPAGLPDAAAAAAGPSLTGPLPKTGAANGAVVTGFPTAVVPVPDGLTVVSSSVSASGDRLQVGLQASSDSAPTDVTAAYVAALGGAGFAVGDSPALPGSTATAFTRGPDGLVLTVRDRIGGGTELSLAGTLTTAG